MKTAGVATAAVLSAAAVGLSGCSGHHTAGHATAPAEMSVQADDPVNHATSTMAAPPTESLDVVWAATPKTCPGVGVVTQPSNADKWLRHGWFIVDEQVQWVLGVPNPQGTEHLHQVRLAVLYAAQQLTHQDQIDAAGSDAKIAAAADDWSAVSKRIRHDLEIGDAPEMAPDEPGVDLMARAEHEAHTGCKL